MHAPQSSFQVKEVAPQSGLAARPEFSRIALVADKRGWAFDSIASHIKPLIERDYSACISILYTDDYISPERFIRHIQEQKYDIVHWFWRKHLKDLIEHYVGTGDVQLLEKVLVRSAISFSVPEGLLLDANDVFDLSHIFHLADGYCTVSQRLYDLYAEQTLLPQPQCVLYDRTNLIVELVNRARQQTPNNGNILNVVWAGNSEWGRWLGLEDAKGLQLIRSAIEGACREGCTINFAEFDAATKPVSQEEIGRALLAADVYICASGELEGTPLPVVEAMAAGCAVITADVGVAREVFPTSQHKLIVDREIDSFAAALQQCAKNIAWTRRIGGENRETMRDWCTRPLHRAWMHFFDSIHTRSHSGERQSEKANILHSLHGSPLSASLGALRQLSRRSGIVKAVGKQVLPFALPLLRKVADRNSAKSRLRRLRNFRNTLALNQRAPIPTLAVYTPMWSGVAASTRALFKNTVPVPFFLQQHPHTVTTEELTEYVEILRVLSPERLILSGAETLHWELLARYRTVCPQTRVEIISHSSQIQWVDDHFREEFMRWLPAYHAGLIQKIWVFKRGLDVILRNYGIEAEVIENYLPQKIRTPRALGGMPIKVGIWSVDNDWRKNLLSQFLAFAGDTRFIVHYTATDAILSLLLSKFGVPHVRVNEGPLPRGQLLRWMAKMDINLYITLSECSPMVPLESMSMAVPVLVGPTTSYFDDHPILHQLVVPSPEDMGCIRNSVDRVLANYAEISEALLHHGLGRERLWAEVKQRLNGLAA